MMGQQGVAGITSGNLTLDSTGTTWMNPQTLGTNESMDINHWSQVELQNFVKWFIEVNYPDAVKQYQAIRDIERQAEKVKELELEIQRQEFMKQYWANQARGAQNAYTNPQSLYTALPTQAITITPPKQESIWDAMKRMAGIK